MAPEKRFTDEYRAKRDFKKTPEPAPGTGEAPGPEPRFVVHRHDARRLHYDLRLEMDGALVSWAVPKGLSFDPKDKRLAVHTEDHPIEYESFEGVIPKGEYGAGTMTIFDRGTFEVLNGVGRDAVEGGELKFILRGERFRGEWHLVRTAGQNAESRKPGEVSREWLLFKARDRYVRREGEPLFDVNLADAKRRSLPKRLEAMEPAEAWEAFSDPEWIFELGLRGRRTMVRIDRDDVSLRFPGNSSRAKPRLEGLVRELRRVRATQAWIDGMLVVLDDQQRPDVEGLEEALRTGGEGVCYYAFDLLHYDDWDLRGLPLLTRKRGLASVLPPSAQVLYVDHVAEKGEGMARGAAAGGFDRVIAKRAESAYAPGASSDWGTLPVEPDVLEEEKDVVEALQQWSASDAPKLKLSNPDKVFWPVEGYTKRDLAEYYDAVADYMVPYLANRPVGMRRFPDGIEGKSFYHKQVPDHAPEWVTTELIRSDDGGKDLNTIVCNDRETLLYLANLGSIDVHPWLSSLGSLDSPDWALIDLDPDGSPFPKVVQVARAVGRVLNAIGVESVVKTSGASGIHIYVPLVPGYTYEHSRMFCEGVARVVARELPQVATVERVVGKRHGKVYVDYLQNHRGQTVAPPYAVRPVAGATVSAPLEWDELHNEEIDPSLFSIKTAPERFDRVGDLFEYALTGQQDLIPAIEGLQQYMAEG